MYQYEFVEVPGAGGSEAEQGWRLKQIVTPFDEKAGMFCAAGYQAIFEKEA